LLFYDGSRAARVIVSKSGMPNSLNFCVIFVLDEFARDMHNTIRRARVRTPGCVILINKVKYVDEFKLLMTRNRF